jgi:hypothetical protein
MEAITPIVVGVLLALFTTIQAWINKGRFDALDKRLDRIENEVSERRSGFMQLALALGSQPRPQTR